VIEGLLAGRVHADKKGRLSLTYEQAWRASPQGYSLSVSMPLADIAYPQRSVWPYLWNLLPENPNVLQRWAQQYHVSAGNPFKLLGHVGADVPGAAQFIQPERLAEIQAEQHPRIEWMTVDQLSERLRQLRDDISAVRRPGDIGKMSLPGAQAKTAFYRDPHTGRWGVPGGRTPTTHIIKPCIPGFDGLVENEHVCQDIAARLGLPAARSSVLMLDQPYIVVERYDRLPPAPGTEFPRRIHQEDMCQALGVMPTRKYQEDGGPGISQITTLIRRVSADPETDVERFLKANMFNWLIGGTDAHAKNYSFLIDAGDAMRLAPLYDLSSQLPYPDLVTQRVSMRIGDHYDMGLVSVADWQNLARSCALEEERVVSMLTDMAQALPDVIADAHTQARTAGLSEEVVGPLAEQLIANAGERLAWLSAPGSTGGVRRIRGPR
ncbi:MAG TPA: type II toxin-antitoxin system HipA family toxin, partial [Steroidobacteraceae bacterium]|nr:type II toxin-antitoxin system HipA family toxin [Steroidobacteraceae bacterium]